MSEVTRILKAAEQGDAAASERLLPLVYEELRKLASVRLANEKPGQTLQATALVHEAYVRLVTADTGQRWDSSGHFFAAAAEAIRRILVDKAREKLADKRGGGQFHRIELDYAATIDLEPKASDRLLALDIALERFQVKNPVKAELVKLRYFAGLTGAQAADCLGIGASTADKYWAYAKVWLRAEMQRIVEQES